MKTYNDSNMAWRMMVLKNKSYKAANNKKDLIVYVEGPEDGQATIMDIREAINNGFSYSWSAR